MVVVLVGAQHLLFPRFWTDLAGIEIDETVTWRLIGAALVAMAVASVLAAGERAWSRVRIIVVLEVIWFGLATVGRRDVHRGGPCHVPGTGLLGARAVGPDRAVRE